MCVTFLLSSQGIMNESCLNLDGKTSCIFRWAAAAYERAQFHADSE